MSEMVERVARSIWAFNEDTDCPDYERLSAHAKERANEWARAAIEAMREPTEEMIDRTAMQGESPMITARGSRARIAHYWRLMIDEAL